MLDLDNLGSEDGAHFAKTTASIRRSFDALIEGLYRDHVERIDWIVSGIASRNVFHSPLFERCCRLAFVNEKLAERTGPVEVRVADHALAAVIRDQFCGERPDVVVDCTERLSRRMWRLFRAPRQFLISMATFAMRWAGRSRPRAHHDERIVLIDTFVLNTRGGAGSIVDRAYRDRYYPGLLEALTPEERRSIYFLPTLIGFRNPGLAFKRIRSATTPFVVHDDYLRLSDYLFALASPFRLLRLRIPEASFAGFDIRSLLLKERWETCSDLNCLQALLYYRFAKRLAESGVRVRVLVEWYENQVIDRGMIVGFHRFHPETKIVGYRGFIAAKYGHIHVYPTVAEMRARAVPDVLTVTGPAVQDEMRALALSVPVDVGPGFRFERLWRDRTHAPDRNAFSVLVGLPIELDDSAFILDLLTDVPALAGDNNVAVRVKPHPTWSGDRIRALLPANRWPLHWQFVTGDFHDALEMSNLLISNGSSVCLESLARGIPVIVIAPRNGMIENVIPDAIDAAMWAISRDRDELAETIDRFRKNDKEKTADFERHGHEIRAAYFQPVDRPSVLRFLALEGNNTRTRN